MWLTLCTPLSSDSEHLNLIDCIIWTIKGSELDSYPTLFIGDVANCILNLGQTFLSYFISLDSRISVYVTS